MVIFVLTFQGHDLCETHILGTILVLGKTLLVKEFMVQFILTNDLDLSRV